MKSNADLSASDAVHCYKLETVFIFTRFEGDNINWLLLCAKQSRPPIVIRVSQFNITPSNALNIPKAII